MSTPAPCVPPRRLLTIEEYYRLWEHGLLPGGRCELIEGVVRVEGKVVDVPALLPRHGGRILRLTEVLLRAAGERARVSVRGPLQLQELRVPQPDLALLEPHSDYEDRLPGAADALLIVEVSDSGQQSDRWLRVPLYAAHGISEVWLLDLPQGVLHVHRAPSGGQYTQVVQAQAPGAIEPAGLPGMRIDLDHLLCRGP